MFEPERMYIKIAFVFSNYMPKDIKLAVYTFRLSKIKTYCMKGKFIRACLDFNLLVENELFFR